MPCKLQYAFYLIKKKPNKSQVGFGTWFWFYSLSESNLKSMKELRGAHLACGSHPAIPSTEAGCSPRCVSPVKIPCSHVPRAVSVCTLPSLAHLNQHRFVFTPCSSSTELSGTDNLLPPCLLPSSLSFWDRNNLTLLASRMRNGKLGVYVHSGRTFLVTRTNNFSKCPFNINSI